MKSGYIEFLHLSTYHCKNLATCCLGAYRTESRDLVIGKSAGVDLLLCFFSTTTCMRVVITLCNSITICKDVCSCCHLASYLHNHAIYACEHAAFILSDLQFYQQHCVCRCRYWLSCTAGYKPCPLFCQGYHTTDTFEKKGPGRQSATFYAKQVFIFRKFPAEPAFDSLSTFPGGQVNE